MPSKAIASLDAWLARAEEVLAEQRESAISPSLGLSEGDGGYTEWTTTFAALSEGLEGLLESLCRRPGRWILIVEDERRRHLFWQALAFEDGSLCTEVVSNTYLDDGSRWSAEQESQLLALCWAPPNPPQRPNFINVEATTSPDTDVVCQRALATLRELFELSCDDLVFVKLFPSAIRGDTPASPEYSTEKDASPLPDPRTAEEWGLVDAADDGHSCGYSVAPQDDRPSRIAHHYFPPNVGSDEELEADIEAWLDAVADPDATGGVVPPIDRFD
jgi:hypothetical protein